MSRLTNNSSGTYRRLRTPFFLNCILCIISFAIGAAGAGLPHTQHPVGHIEAQSPPATIAKDSTFPAFLDALDIMQEEYFETWEGMWPTSIDWTSAVLGTYLSGALKTLSTSFSQLESDKDAENLVNKYFSQLVGSYFGQDAFSLRRQAYDDMLWVVLGWLESITFINSHSALHYEATPGKSWYGKQYVPAFAHRARLFWDMASNGWDTEYCDGGMLWSPYVLPYKNAVTNELYIAASISMYLHFPGDQNTSPFGMFSEAVPPADPHDPKYLAAAIEAYDWLKSSNMTNDKGLYVDGFHISGWQKEHPENSTWNTKCDERNEMVYTYNQGVLLTGQRGLYEATAEKSYLSEGHKLIVDVIAATGWDLQRNFTPDPPFNGTLATWHGLGRSGILEEICDAGGYCSQNSHTFKGIFFHHLTWFCSRIPDELLIPGKKFTDENLEDDKKWHSANCRRYQKWIQHNSDGALRTRNKDGRFGMWWGAPSSDAGNRLKGDAVIPRDAVDYRNSGLPRQWELSSKFQQRPNHRSLADSGGEVGILDLNDRGRGRTVETQGGGLSVLRATWEIVDRGPESEH